MKTFTKIAFALLIASGFNINCFAQDAQQIHKDLDLANQTKSDTEDEMQGEISQSDDSEANKADTNNSDAVNSEESSPTEDTSINSTQNHSNQTYDSPSDESGALSEE